MKDKLFLAWIHERLELAHGESPHLDYMHKLRSIIDAMDPEQDTPIKLDLALKFKGQSVLTKEDTTGSSLEDMLSDD